MGKSASSDARKSAFYGIAKAAASTAPAACNGVIVLCRSDLLEVLSASALSKELGVPVRTFPAATLEEIICRVKEVNPDSDRVLVIHSPDEEALTLANGGAPDVDKGVESDRKADELCDVAEAALKQIPYLRVVMSTMLPRFDAEERVGMSVPNNVRKASPKTFSIGQVGIGVRTCDLEIFIRNLARKTAAS
jgi:hypothetical protein